MSPRRTKQSVKIFLLAILVFGVVLRFWKLGENPSGLYVDEAAIGYNAYSFLKTGLDEYGKAWPVFLRLFGAFSSPLYTYLTVIPVFVFDLSVFSARFLSAVAGSIAVLIIYLILNEFDFKHKRSVTLLTTFLYAFSPWAIFLSRMGTEGHLGFLFTAVAVLALLKTIKRSSQVIVASIFLALATYTYQPLRLTSILIIIAFVGLVWVRDRKIGNIFRPVNIVALLIFVCSQIPQVLLFSSPAFTFRAAGLVYTSGIIGWVREFLSQFFAYFSPKNLFILGDEDLQRSIPTLGVFYVWQVILYVIGLITLVKKSRDWKVKFIWILMMIFACVPALTRDPFSTVRSQGLLIPFMVVFAFALDVLQTRIGSLKTYIGVMVFSLASLVLLWRGYFVLLPFERAKIWNYGFSQLQSELANYSDQTIVIDQSRTIPIYEEMLFFGKFDPQTYQQSQSRAIVDNYYSDLNFDLSRKFANLEIRPIYWKGDICRKLILVGDDLAVSDQQAKEHNLSKLFEVYNPNRELVFRAWQTHPNKDCVLYDNSK